MTSRYRWGFRDYVQNSKRPAPRVRAGGERAASGRRASSLRINSLRAGRMTGADRGLGLPPQTGNNETLPFHYFCQFLHDFEGEHERRPLRAPPSPASGSKWLPVLSDEIQVG